MLNRFAASIAQAVTTAPVPTSGPSYSEDFETGLFTGQHIQHIDAAYPLQRVTDIVQSGSYAARFELRAGDGQASGGTRTEVLFDEVELDSEMWYSLALYFPSDGWDTDTASDTILQWWQTSSSSQSATLRTRNNQVYLQVGNVSTSLNTHTLVPSIQKDKWYEFVFRFVHSNGSDGLIESWVDGVKQQNITGGNMYPLSENPMPQFKVGIYKASWNTDTTDTTLRVLYVDNVKIGRAGNSYQTMKPYIPIT